MAMKAARSRGLLSTWRSFMQPMNSLAPNGKLSGTLGTPPRNKGPVRSRDLCRQTGDGGRERDRERVRARQSHQVTDLKLFK